MPTPQQLRADERHLMDASAGETPGIPRCPAQAIRGRVHGLVDEQVSAVLMAQAVPPGVEE
eukprot:3552528-Alexandrium_andersonii.AAC.1